MNTTKSITRTAAEAQARLDRHNEKPDTRFHIQFTRTKTGNVVHTSYIGSSRTWCGCNVAAKVTLPAFIIGSIECCERCG